MVAILTPIYEAEFLGFSYGFRPKRNQHQALDALAFGIGRRRINWVLDCDVQSFFDKVNQSWLIRFVEHRIGDRRIIRLIAKWLTAGVLEGGHVIATEEGTPQGAVISPLLANIYLHYVYDLWVHQWRQRHATGDVIVVRYADDTIVGFEHRHEAEQFLTDLKARLARFGLTLHPDKTRLIEFGRSAIANGMLEVSASRSRSTSWGSRIIARPDGAARVLCSGGNRWPSECALSFERSRNSSWPCATKGLKGRAGGSAKFCAAGWLIMLCR